MPFLVPSSVILDINDRVQFTSPSPCSLLPLPLPLIAFKSLQVSRHREQYWLSMYVNKLVAALPRVEFQCLVVGPQVAAVEGVSQFSDREEEFTDFLGQNAVSEGEGEAEGEGEGGEGVESGRVTANEDEAKAGAGLGVDAGVEGKGVMYDALVLQLGSFFRYALYSPASQPPRKQGKWSAHIQFDFHLHHHLHLATLRHFYHVLAGELLGCHLFKRYTSPVSYLLVPSDFEIENLPKQLADQLSRPKKIIKEYSDIDNESEGEGDGEGKDEDYCALFLTDSRLVPYYISSNCVLFHFTSL